MLPLAVGFVQRGQDFETGRVTLPLLGKLLTYCDPRYTVCEVAHPRTCPLCNQRVTVKIEGSDVVLGSAEIRVLGQDDIFAAPDMIYHLVEVHEYAPPPEFLDALKRSYAGSIEHRAILNALR